MPRAHSQSEPIQATVRPLDLALHEIQVTLALPAEAVARGAVLALPAWTPGSYLIRDYARFLDRLTAVDADGQPLALEKLDKQRWRLAAGRGGATVSYRLFCNELTVRTNHVDAGSAHLVGAATFLYLEEPGPRPFRVAFAGWPGDWRIATALAPAGDGYLAADHDTLVDSPIELGRFRMHSYSQQGCDFRFAISGDHPGDETRILAATQAITAACAAIFGGFPGPRYLFLLSFCPGMRGGLEHRDCTSLLADPQQMEKAEGYWDLFVLIAHEFFHVWNVKRLRDPALGPFDYQRETGTRLLWFHEGLTSFMQYTIAMRAGAVPWSWVGKRLAGSWTDNTIRAGRNEQSLEEASFDAWIRHYKPTEFSPNSTVSYYDKGAMVAWLMDAELRLASAGAHGLDQLFALLWRRFGDGPVTDGDLRAAYGELTGKDPAPFWSRFIQGRAELEPGAIEQAYGLRFTAKAPWELLGNGDAEDPDAVRRAKVYSGLVFSGEAPSVVNVFPGSPAARAGLGYGATILAVNGWRTLTAGDVQRRLGDRGPGDPVEILAAERGRVRTCGFTLEAHPHRTIQLEPDPAAGSGQREAFRAWTGQAFPGPRKGFLL
jgi:predicted metalloprotease with PDZ domain